MSGKAKSKQQEALQFLDDLDSFDAPPAPASANAPPSPSGTPAAGEEEVYAFIDEITLKSAAPPRPSLSHIDRPPSRAGTPTLRKATGERVKVGGAPLLHGSGSGSPVPPLSRMASPISRTPSSATTAAPVRQDVPVSSSSSGAWGWGSVWNSASAAIQQAKSVVDEQVKNLPQKDQARKWGEGVLEYAKAAQLDKIGQDFKRVGLSTLTDILNVVAPPISEHEVIQVWLSHDMKGYEGVETLVYRALARILEQVEGGDLVVNRGDESRPKDTNETRDLNAVETLDAAIKLAQANLDEIIKRNVQPPAKAASAQNPTTYSYVYLRIQPFLTALCLPRQAPRPTTSEGDPSAPSPPPEVETTQLQFILYLSDPSHQITHSTVTQAVPGKWLELWEDYDWVEDLVVEAIRVGVEVIGQEYIVSRMSWDKKVGKSKEGEEEGQEQVPPAVEVTEAS